jgi:hypothetical protein
MKNRPGPDFVGFHPSVDLDDIKLRVIQDEGLDAHEYDLWDDRANALANKPYINQQAIQPIVEPEKLTQAQMNDRIDTLLVQNNLKGDTFVRGNPGSNSQIDIEVNANDEEQNLAAIRKTLGQ